jgi:hypothetical protein
VSQWFWTTFLNEIEQITAYAYIRPAGVGYD